MRIRWAVLAAALLAWGCGDRGTEEPSASLAMRLTLPSGLAINSLELTVYDQNGTCTTDGDADGNPLPDLSQMPIPLGQPTTIHVAPGKRTFSVVAFDAAFEP